MKGFVLGFRSEKQKVVRTVETHFARASSSRRISSMQVIARPATVKTPFRLQWDPVTILCVGLHRGH